MPARARKLRTRMSSRVDTVSPELERWFRGEVDACWEMLLPYEREMLGVRWRFFAADNPGARPPLEYEWLADPADERQPTQEQIRTARKMLMRSQLR